MNGEDGLSVAEESSVVECKLSVIESEFSVANSSAEVSVSAEVR